MGVVGVRINFQEDIILPQSANHTHIHVQTSYARVRYSQTHKSLRFGELAALKFCMIRCDLSHIVTSASLGVFFTTFRRCLNSDGDVSQ